MNLGVGFLKKRRVARRRLRLQLWFLLGVCILARFCTHVPLKPSPELIRDPIPLWISARSKLFSRRWVTHKAKNVAVYACISTRHFPIVKSVIYFLFTCPDTIYAQRYDDFFDVPWSCFTHKCLKAYGRSHYIYAEFVLNTYSAITSRRLAPPKPSDDGKIAVIVEPRNHPLLLYTVKQVMSTLDNTWSLQIYVSDANEVHLRNSLEVSAGGIGQNIILTRLSDFGLSHMSDMGNRVQSAFSAHAALYQTIRSEHILWFQVDVLLRHPPDANWLLYAYVGAELEGCQYPTCRPRFCRGICAGGNSGLSLRRRSSLMRVSTPGALPRDLWGVRKSNEEYIPNRFSYFQSDELHDNSHDRWFQDDLQIAYKLEKLGLLPPGQVLPRFAVGEVLPKEGLQAVNPSGLHKPWMTPTFPTSSIVWLLQAPYDRACSPRIHTTPCT